MDKNPPISSITRVKRVPLSIFRSLVLAVVGISLIPATHLEGAIVLTDDFETGANNLNSPGAPIAGQWITTPNLVGWILRDNLGVAGNGDVAGTDHYSSPDGIYFAPHSGNIVAAFYAFGNGGGTFTSSMERLVPTNLFTIGTYDISFWISNPLADTNARQNLFSLRWGSTLLDLSSYDPRFKLPNLLNDELPGGPNEYVLDANTNWFQVVITGLTATSANTLLKFTGQNNHNATLVDDVQVVETPEPSTIVLLGAGMVIAGLRRRRRAGS